MGGMDANATEDNQGLKSSQTPMPAVRMFSPVDSNDFDSIFISVGSTFSLQGPPLGSRFSAPPPQTWKTHLFDCMQYPQNAIITLFFPCVTFGQIAEILDNGGTSCVRSGIKYWLYGRCTGMACRYRSKLRAKFDLVARPAPDWVIHCFCHPCALSQEYRELQLRGLDPSIGHAGNVMTPPMQQRIV